MSNFWNKLGDLIMGKPSVESCERHILKLQDNAQTLKNKLVEKIKANKELRYYANLPTDQLLEKLKGLKASEHISESTKEKLEVGISDLIAQIEQCDIDIQNWRYEKLRSLGMSPQYA